MNFRNGKSDSTSLTALFVETTDYPAWPEKDKERLRFNIHLAEQLGATVETVHGEDVPYQIIEFARMSGVSKVVVGRSRTEKEKEEGDYGGVASGSYNQAPTSEELKERTSQAAADFKKRYKDATGEEFTGEIPADLVTASGSGLDPDISPESAKIQIPIVAANSGLSEEEVAQIVEDHTSRKVLGIFGEERVNVLKCNLDIAELTEEALP